jgi:hypothetical protein
MHERKAKLSAPQDKPTGINFWVQGIVAARNGKPYVQLSNQDAMIAQLTIAEARSIALDLFRAASYAEADAMLHGFFKKHGIEQGALGALMMDFRDFRHALDMEKVDTRYSDPDTGKEP